MTLRFNARTGDYFLATIQDVKAKETGLTLSTSSTGPMGEPVYFTKDPYAALNFIKEADDTARERLQSLWTDYQSSWATESPNTYEMANGIILRPYQNAAIDYAVTKGPSCNGILCGDDVGVGKSFTAIGYCNHVQASKVLLVCPGAIRTQWRDNIKIASTIDKVRCYPILRSADGVANWPNYTIISYDLLRNPALHAALCAIDWDVIVLDEAHMLKEINARRTQALFGGGRRAEFKDVLVSHAKHVLALTGTPLPNRPRECHTLAHALCPESIDWMKFEDFRYRFNPSGRMANGHVREEKGRLPELQARLRCNFMVRRLKADVLKDLPDKSYEFAYIEKDGVISDVVRKERMLNYTVEDLKKPQFQIFGEISTIRREMGEAKIPQSIEHIKYLLDVMEVPKVVLFSIHHSVMDGLAEGLKGYGVSQHRGGMSETAKRNSLMAFLRNDETGHRIFSAQLDSAGVGIDGLQNVCSHAVVIEPAWTQGANEQAAGRLHRSGQHANVIMQFVVVEGSIDEMMLATVIRKVHTVHDALDSSTVSKSGLILPAGYIP